MNDLPIHEVLPSLRAQLVNHNALVLVASPGSGKTTGVPLALLNESWLREQKILILEPRRLAARAACRRMAQMVDDEIGGLVGYRIRFETKISKRTRVEVITEGILARRLQTDPTLEGVGLVIFDEFHERHLQTDLALALVRDSQRLLRNDLKLLVMSATLDGAGCARMLDAPLVVGTGRSFPVEVIYSERDPQGALSEIVCQSITRAIARHNGHVLAFLPGAREIRRTLDLLEKKIDNDTDVCPLYGDLSWDLQDRALRNVVGRRKVVLATPIAETSLTIEGVNVVIDSGYARTPQFDPRTGLSRLVTTRVSCASADQRAGRAGRLGPGVCYRLWSESTQRGLLPQPIPEIRAADLAAFALDLAAWGTPVEDLEWLDPPPVAALAQARNLLMQLDALDAQGIITAVGREIAALPLHPRLAHMLRCAKDLRLGSTACDIAALISERDIMIRDGLRSWDISERLDALTAYRRQGDSAARVHGADPKDCRWVDRAASQWRNMLQLDDGQESSDSNQIGTLLTLAYPDRIARQRAPNETRYILANGRGARLPVSKNASPPYIVVASLDAGDGEGTVHLAAPVTLTALRGLLKSQIVTEEIVRWEEKSEAIVAQREERIGKLVLNVAPLVEFDSGALRCAMLEGVRRLGLHVLPWTPEARTWQARVLSLRHWCPEDNWPDVSDEALYNTLDRWLGPFIDGITRRTHLERLDLAGILKNQLDWDQIRKSEEGAPLYIEVPSGRRVRLEYVEGQSPILAVKLQEMFGLADTPRVAWGRVAVTVHLLSPARRPIQVTQDLRGFWERTYPDVKKELKGRYPRHPWPDDPWDTVPTARVQRKRN